MSEQRAESVRLARQVIDVIENIPDDAWSYGQRRGAPLWKALDEIHEIVTLALLNDGRADVPSE